MLIGAELAAALPLLRELAESRMTVSCTVRRKTTEMTPGPDGFDVPVWDTVYADLKCWVDRQSSQSGPPLNINIGAGVEVTRARRVLKVPHYATDTLDHDVARINGGACDGIFFDIEDVTDADQKKQQELPVIEIGRPEGWV